MKKYIIKIPEALIELLEANGVELEELGECDGCVHRVTEMCPLSEWAKLDAVDSDYCSWWHK